VADAFDMVMDPNYIGATDADQGGFGSTWGKLKSGMVGKILHDLYTLPERAGQAAYDYGQTGQYNPAPIMEAAMTATTGGMPFAQAGALGSAGGKGIRAALPMDEASRMARAREQGYGPKLYHGTSNEVTEFKPNRSGAVYLTDEPRIADIYADIRYGDGKRKWGHPVDAYPNVMPVRAKNENPLAVSDLGPNGEPGYFTDNLAAALGKNLDEMPHVGNAYRDLINEARNRGHDMIVMKDFRDLGGPQTQYMSLKPKEIRSEFAAFDPANKDSGNLLASILAAGGTPLGALMAQGNETQQ
jgi:hypothetical protein